MLSQGSARWELQASFADLLCNLLRAAPPSLRGPVAAVVWSGGGGGGASQHPTASRFSGLAYLLKYDGSGDGSGDGGTLRAEVASPALELAVWVQKLFGG